MYSCPFEGNILCVELKCNLIGGLVKVLKRTPCMWFLFEPKHKYDEQVTVCSTQVPRRKKKKNVVSEGSLQEEEGHRDTHRFVEVTSLSKKHPGGGGAIIFGDLFTWSKGNTHAHLPRDLAMNSGWGFLDSTLFEWASLCFPESQPSSSPSNLSTAYRFSTGSCSTPALPQAESSPAPFKHTVSPELGIPNERASCRAQLDDHEGHEEVVNLPTSYTRGSPSLRSAKTRGEKVVAQNPMGFNGFVLRGRSGVVFWWLF